LAGAVAVVAGSAAAGLVAVMMAECSPSPTWWVKATDTCSNPAAASPASYSLQESAPVRQPTQAPRSARSSATTSVIPMRAPKNVGRLVSRQTNRILGVVFLVVGVVAVLGVLDDRGGPHLGWRGFGAGRHRHAGADQETTRLHQLPSCRERVHVDASVCPHCRSDISD